MIINQTNILTLTAWLIETRPGLFAGTLTFEGGAHPLSDRESSVTSLGTWTPFLPLCPLVSQKL